MSRGRIVFVASVAAGILAACSGDDTAPLGPKDSGTIDATADDGSSGAIDSAPPDVAVPDTSTGGGGPIACGQVPTCDGKTQDCCLDAPAVCAAKGACTGNVLSCSGTISCATGDVCCASTTRLDGGAGDAGDGGDGGGGGIGTVKATCETTCAKGQLQLCTDNADCTVPGDECRKGPSGLKGCRKIVDGGAADASDSG